MEKTRMKPGYVFVSPMGGYSNSAADPKMLERCVEERLSIVKELKKRGYRVLIPVNEYIENPELKRKLDRKVRELQPEKTGFDGKESFLHEVMANYFVGRAKKLGARTFRFRTLKRPQDFEWLRDRWTQFGRMVHFSSVRSKKEVMSKRGMKSKWIIASPLGYGGIAVRGRDFLMVQSPEKYGGMKPILNALRGRGWKIYSVPVPEKPGKEIEKYHIDMNVGIAPLENGHAIVTTKHYLEQNRELFGKIARETGSRIVEIPKEEERLHPANFLVLPDGKVLMTGGAPKTKRMLEDAGATVYETIPLEETVKTQGGLRCLTNTFEKRKPL